jgi:hypothetical protein
MLVLCDENFRYQLIAMGLPGIGVDEYKKRAMEAFQSVIQADMRRLLLPLRHRHCYSRPSMSPGLPVQVTHEIFSKLCKKMLAIPSSAQKVRIYLRSTSRRVSWRKRWQESDVHFIKYIRVTQMWIHLGVQAVGRGLITLPARKRDQRTINTKDKDDKDSSLHKYPRGRSRRGESRSDKNRRLKERARSIYETSL